MAGLSLLGALVVWNLAYFFFVLILLGLTTAVRGDEGPYVPVWIAAAAGGLAAGLLVWGIVDHWLHRFVRLSDRSIIGPHLVTDFALLPVRMTFAVWGNLGAVLSLEGDMVRRAWELLGAISGAKRARLTSLTLIEPNVGQLHRLLRALQMTDCIDLHAGEEDWYYTVRGNLDKSLQRKLAESSSA